MPSSSDRLRAKFMINGSDGIEEAERIIKNAGGSISSEWIISVSTPMLSIKDLRDAVEFLLEEWDYGIEDYRTKLNKTDEE